MGPKGPKGPRGRPRGPMGPLGPPGPQVHCDGSAQKMNPPQKIAFFGKMAPQGPPGPLGRVHTGATWAPWAPGPLGRPLTGATWAPGPQSIAMGRDKFKTLPENRLLGILGSKIGEKKLGFGPQDPHGEIRAGIMCRIPVLKSQMVGWRPIWWQKGVICLHRWCVAE